ncbi:MAG: SGNH/GDSL hydrolase family protein [Alphaproteobacteria bacterium]|nr:SGNH/GDSL hydrolase family protein [Alphaproteobacteria bacterium]
MTIYYASNFDSAATGSLPAGWANGAGTWQVGTVAPTGAHTNSFGSVGHVDGDVALLSGVAAVADMQLSFTQKIPGLTATAAPMVGALLRMDAAYANGYAILVDQTGTLGALRFLVFRRLGGSFGFVGASGAIAGISFAASDTVTLRAQIAGSTISLKLWPTGIAEPAAWQYSVSDASITAPGHAGLYYALDTAGSATMAVCDVVLSDLPSLAVTPPSGVVAGAAMVVSGTYAGQDPAGLNVAFDGGAYAAAASPAIGGGAFSFSVTSPASGAHTVSVQEAGDASVVGTASFTASSGAISVTTPAGAIAGQAMIVSGFYSGVVPSGLDVAFDGGAFTAAPSPAIGGGAYSFTVTAPAIGPHTVSVRETGFPSLSAASGSFTARLAPNDAAMLYSPFGWNVQAASATTANAGSGFRTLFTGVICVLTFDVSGMVTPASQLWWRIDNGPWTQATLAASITCSVPAATAGNADVPYHLLEVVVKSITETQNRWNAGASARVAFTGLSLSAGALVAAPRAAPLRLLVFGDSLTEGVRTLGEAASLDTDRNDATLGWAFRLGALLGAEVGVVGFGGQGLLAGGSGNVPALGGSFASLYAGTSRSFGPAPDLVVIDIGANDGVADTVAAMTGVLNGLIAACPAKPIAVLRPFNGAQAANLQAAIALCSAPAACHWIDTTGLFDPALGADAIGLHPSGPNNIAAIAPQIAALLRPLVAGGSAAPPGFRPGFRQSLLA